MILLANAMVVICEFVEVNSRTSKYSKGLSINFGLMAGWTRKLEKLGAPDAKNLDHL